ncbi:IucA/IucC family siderophore biosynthesis protein, partial [Streptomyces lunaelactis]|uniref:IucA/IucC family protein n=1 Tax=Streptomyces lunaelactis TaxID=1535768 RepID=UPI001C2F8B44|nr:IucA/IucC family siderophore biosynthesis protein [Streptomyces lunaelactis]
RALPWLAVHRELARYRGVPALADPRTLYAQELPERIRGAFTETIAGAGREPADYLWLPVHPWQWYETIAPLYAPQIAAGQLIELPSDGELRLTQQSIRTVLNISRPTGRSVKLPLSILNTLVWRGLPTERTLAAPAVTGWIHAVRDADPYLRETRVILLGETASVSVAHPI